MIVRTDEEIAVIARAWLGTPFVHQASMKGQGADCLGFVRGVWQEVHADRAIPKMDYAPHWFEQTCEERLLDGLSNYLSICPNAEISSGRILLFRLFRKYPAQHVGLSLSGAANKLTLIHSIAGKGVVEVPMSKNWQARLVAQFRI
ncbi:MAG: NlpC/P60 family protein [Pseudomonadota bacterium]